MPQKFTPIDECAINRPDWPWWLVMWKAAMTLLILAPWGMALVWAFHLGFRFASFHASGLAIWKVPVVVLLNVAPLWSLWALGSAIWTERRTWTIRIGLVLGAVLIVFFSIKILLGGEAFQGSISIVEYLKSPLSFFVLTLACLTWELLKQFAPKRSN